MITALSSNKYECIIDWELAGDAVYPGRCRNPTEYLLEEQSCQILSQSCLKQRSLGLFFEEIAPTTRTTVVI